MERLIAEYCIKRLSDGSISDDEKQKIQAVMDMILDMYLEENS